MNELSPEAAAALEHIQGSPAPTSEPAPDQAEPEPAPEGADVAPDGSPDDTPAEPPPGPATLDDLAEKAGMSLTELYDQAKVKLDTGETVSLHEAKKLASRAGEADLQSAGLARDRAEFQAERLRATEQLNLLADAIRSGSADATQLQQLEENRTQLVQAAAARTTEVIPEWRDGEVASKDKVAIAAVLDRFGFPKGAIESIHQPYEWLLLNTFRQWDARVSQLLAEARAPKQRNKGNPKPRESKSTLEGLTPESKALLDAIKGK